MEYQYLTENGRVPMGTVCHFVSRCKYRNERCFEAKTVDFSCGTARLIEHFLDEFHGIRRIQGIAPSLGDTVEYKEE